MTSPPTTAKRVTELTKERREPPSTTSPSAAPLQLFLPGDIIQHPLWEPVLVGEELILETGPVSYPASLPICCVALGKLLNLSGL